MGDKLQLKPPVGSDFSPLANITPASLISGAISLLLLVITLIFFFMFLWGGYRWITSEGDEKNVAAAKNHITNAAVGLFVIFCAWMILQIIGVIFGIELLGPNGLTIPTLQP